MKVQVRAVCCTLDAFEISSKYNNNVMLFAPLLDYTEHSSSMSGGGPEQSEVISAVNTIASFHWERRLIPDIAST